MLLTGYYYVWFQSKFWHTLPEHSEENEKLITGELLDEMNEKTDDAYKFEDSMFNLNYIRINLEIYFSFFF